METDGASYHQSRSVRGRDRLRGEHLQRLGWSFHRLWSTNWFQNPQAEVARLQDTYQRAVAAAEPPAADPPPAEPPPAAAPGPGSELAPTTRPTPRKAGPG